MVDVVMGIHGMSGGGFDDRVGLEDPAHVAVLSGDGVGPEVTSGALAIADIALRRCGKPPIRRNQVKAGLRYSSKTGLVIEPEGRDRVGRSAAVFAGPFSTAGGVDDALQRGMHFAERYRLSARIRRIRAFKAFEAEKTADFVIVCGLEKLRKDPLDGLVRKLARKRRAAKKPATISVIGDVEHAGPLISDAAPKIKTLRTDIAQVLSDLDRQPGQLGVLVANDRDCCLLAETAHRVMGGIMAPVATTGETLGLFQPAHGAFPEITGQNRANPLAAILSAAMMLDDLAERLADRAYFDASVLIEGAIDLSFDKYGLTQGACADMGTRAVTERVITALLELDAPR